MYWLVVLGESGTPVIITFLLGGQSKWWGELVQRCVVSASCTCRVHSTCKFSLGLPPVQADHSVFHRVTNPPILVLGLGGLLAL
jgi:hypothetical protein